MGKTKSAQLLFLFLAIFAVTYVYFLVTKVHTFYGDDLAFNRDYFQLPSFSKRIWLFLKYEKYRPINGFVYASMTALFEKNADYYYIFNIAVLSGCTFVFALTLNLFLNSLPLSFLFSLTFGLSRFFYYNTSQLSCGGALESLPLLFFLCSIYFFVNAAKKDDMAPSKKYLYILYCILFANFAMYTHERYVVLFPFILLVVFLFPGFRILSTRQKIIAGIVAIASPIINVLIKKKIYMITFFVGTGGTNIEFSVSQALSFLMDGLLSTR